MTIGFLDKLEMTMVPFLKQVAAHYLADGLENTCFVFPNRRSAVFFRKYIGDVRRESGETGAMHAPMSITINDFFARVYAGEVTDRIRLLVELYESYKAVWPKAETLDEFLFWGEVILADFEDVDKFLVDAKTLFTNVADFREIQDDYSHLSDRQRDAIQHFVNHFRDGDGRLTVHLGGDGSTDGPKMKARFLQIWNILYPLYVDFRERLRDKGMAYEGMVYRDLAERIKGKMPDQVGHDGEGQVGHDGEGQVEHDGRGAEAVADILAETFPEVRRYVFVGLNALNECERTVLARLRDAGLAEFAWDYVSDAVRDRRNKSSVFMRENVRAFPNAFPVVLDSSSAPNDGIPQFHVVSVPSAVGQAKLAPTILGRCNVDNPVETAFVLPDENLLMPLLNSIPTEYGSINVTMGCSLTGGAVHALVKNLTMMQLRLREKGGEWNFYHREVHSIFSNSLFRAVLTPEEEAVVREVKKKGKYYIPQRDLQGGPLLDLVFRPVVTQPKEASAEQNHRIAAYLSDIVSYVGWMVRGVESMLLELDFAKRCIQSITLLDGIGLALLPAGWVHLLEGILAGESVPFRGEPLEGLQVMGPLETRALDFRNIILLSANEGSFPRRSSNPSFIPPELRKGFGLPTFEYQDSVWAYYFYRMIQRAEHVWLLCDSRTEGLKTGEESRYIKQLEYYFQVPLERFVVTSKMELATRKDEIVKTQEDIDAIRNGELSASSLKSYLSCQAKFYYSFVKGLETEDDVLEAMDAGSLGRVYHSTMCELYKPLPKVTKEDLKRLMGDRGGIKAIVRKLILKEMQTVEVSGRDLVVEEVIVEYVLQTLRHDWKLLDGSGSEGFQMLLLEKKMSCEFEGFKIKGFADRIDSYLGGEVRIVDYKTGKVEQADIDITDENAAEIVDKLFGSSNSGRPAIALQLFIYGLLVQERPEMRGRPVVNSIYSVSSLFTDPLEDRPQSAEFVRLTRERLKDLLTEMTSPDVPFSRTEDLNTCSYCDFKMICGR